MSRARTIQAVGLAVLAVAVLWGLNAPIRPPEGALLIRGRTYEEPVGCVNAEESPMHVTNLTGKRVTVHSAPDCRGRSETLEAGGAGDFAQGASVRVP